MGNLASTYFAFGRHADALAMNEQVLEFRRRVLPENHPELGEGCVGKDVVQAVARGYFLFHLSCIISGAAMGNLASTYFAFGRHADALAMFDRTMEFQRRVLPENHPELGEGCVGKEEVQAVFIVMMPVTGTTLCNISFCYETTGSLPRALECAREALRIWQSLPPGHENVAFAQGLVHKLERTLK
jgi:tetratricopeptide (TPR) repeat protein